MVEEGLESTTYDNWWRNWADVREVEEIGIRPEPMENCNKPKKKPMKSTKIIHGQESNIW